MDEIKLAIVDDHEIFVESLSQALSNIKGIKVVFTSNNGLDFVKHCEKSEVPDVVLLDISMPDQDGFETCKRITTKLSSIKVIALTGHKEKQYIAKMIRSGASGYLLKNAKIIDVVNAVKKVADGGLPFNNEAIQVMFDIYKETDGNIAVKNDFTKRELEIIHLVCKEYTTSEIAEKLFLSESTVSSHKNNIFAKMKVKNAIGLAIYAFTHGLLE
ncbi:MAG: response regulator transcription factor [Bacteroidales bacterium]|nr:response regulator transcription factor [Bacteroidales bacterium]